VKLLDLTFIAERVDQPRFGGLRFLSSAAADCGVRHTRSRLVDDVHIAERRRHIGVDHAADTAAARVKQLGNTLPWTSAGEQRAGRPARARASPSRRH